MSRASGVSAASPTTSISGSAAMAWRSSLRMVAESSTISTRGGASGASRVEAVGGRDLEPEAVRGRSGQALRMAHEEPAARDERVGERVQIRSRVGTSK